MAGKGTTIKEAIAKMEEKNEVKASECQKVLLFGQIPPIEKMDASLSTLTCCTQLSLSTNGIEKIANLNALKSLKILSLGRNNIKNLAGLEAVSETLEQLWISYNLIDKLRGITVLKKLKVLYMIFNKVADEGELNKLAELQCLETLTFTGNPLIEKLEATEKGYRKTMESRLKRIKQLDGIFTSDSEMTKDDDDQQQQES